MTRRRSFAIGLLLVWSALWGAACAGNIGTVRDTPAKSDSQPREPTPTAFILPTRVFEREQGVIVVTPEATGFERNDPNDQRLIAKSTIESEPIPRFQERSPNRVVKAETSHFEFIAEDGYFPLAVDELQEPAEEVFEYVSTRLGSSIEGGIALSFRQPDTGSCPARGQAMTWPMPRIYIFADEDTSREQLLGVLAHEVGHILHKDGFAEDLSSGSMFDEGLATWAAGQYWNEWHGTPSLQARVRSYLEAGTYLPLYKHYDAYGPYSEATKADGDCLERRDTLYTEWAAFIGYLLEGYGRDKLFDLLRTSSIEHTETETILKPPDYQAVYGKALNQLEAAWLEDITYRE
jgi:hypothetical protein